jgi:hypothetical protein
MARGLPGEAARVREEVLVEEVRALVGWEALSPELDLVETASAPAAARESRTRQAPLATILAVQSVAPRW